jgi:hypothetical protein
MSGKSLRGSHNASNGRHFAGSGSRFNGFKSVATQQRSFVQREGAAAAAVEEPEENVQQVEVGVQQQQYTAAFVLGGTTVSDASNMWRRTIAIMRLIHVIFTTCAKVISDNLEEVLSGAYAGGPLEFENTPLGFHKGGNVVARNKTGLNAWWTINVTGSNTESGETTTTPFKLGELFRGKFNKNFHTYNFSSFMFAGFLDPISFVNELLRLFAIVVATDIDTQEVDEDKMKAAWFRVEEKTGPFVNKGGVEIPNNILFFCFVRHDAEVSLQTLSKFCVRGRELSESDVYLRHLVEYLSSLFFEEGTLGEGLDKMTRDAAGGSAEEAAGAAEEAAGGEADVEGGSEDGDDGQGRHRKKREQRVMPRSLEELSQALIQVTEEVSALEGTVENRLSNVLRAMDEKNETPAQILEGGRKYVSLAVEFEEKKNWRDRLSEELSKMKAARQAEERRPSGALARLALARQKIVPK